MNPLAVSVKTAAAMVEVSESTIRDAIDKGALATFRVGKAGRAIRIHVTELEAWTKSLTVVGADDSQ